jgi:hypothetical protein
VTCRHVLDLVDAGPLAEYSSAHLEAAWRHARTCPTCGPALEASTAITRELAGLSPDPPGHFAASVAARIARLDTPYRTTGDTSRVRAMPGLAGWWPAASTVAGVIAAVALVAVLPPGTWTTHGFGALWAGWIGAAALVQPASSGEMLAVAGGVVLLVAGLFVSRGLTTRARQPPSSG